MKVVIGVDHSPHSEAALQWVKKQAWPSGAKFVLVSAAPIAAGTYVFAEPSGFVGMENIQREELESHRELTKTAEADLVRGGLDVESRVELGDPRDLIVRTAESIGAELVVVGSHGRTGLPRLLMGSVASYVVTHAPCNVMVIKRPAAGAPR